MRISHRVAALSVLVVALGACSSSESDGTVAAPSKSNSAGGTPLRIGNVGTYSGIAGPSFATGQQMLRVWEQWVNAHGGLSGHPVVLYSQDDGGDPSKARALAEQMIKKDHVIAFVGNMMPLTADAVGSLLDDASIPGVGGDVSSAAWNAHPMLFPQGTSAISLYDNSVQLDAQFVDDAGGNKWGAIYCAEDSACQTWYDHASHEAPKAGLEEVFHAQVSLAQPSFTAQCLRAKSSGVQILELLLDTASIQRVARDCAAQNYRPLFATGALTVQSDLSQDPNVRQLVSIVPTFPWTLTTGEAAAEYQQAIRTYDPKLNTSAATSAAWASAKLLEAALKDVAVDSDVTAQDVESGLLALRDETLGGIVPPLNYSGGKAAPPATCYFGIKLSDGVWTPVNDGKAYC